MRTDFGYSDRQVDFAAATMKKFMSLETGTTILICRGYTSNQKTNVHIYGFARVTGGFRADPLDGKSWRFKRPAVIQSIEASLPRGVIAEALEKDSMRQTLHQLDEQSFIRIVKALNVPLEV